MEKAVRCSVCGKTLPQYDEDRLDYGNKHYCSACLLKHFTEKKKDAMPIQEAKKLISQMKKDRKQHTEYQITKDEFYRWLINRYDLPELPVWFMTKLKKLEEGTYKGYGKVPISHVADMWTQKMDQLHAINYDKGLYQVGALNYDLAVLLSHYDSYKAYINSKEDCSLDVVETRKRIASTIKIRYNGRERETGVEDTVKELESLFDGK